ncbi:MAG: PEGA domain-containing protein, partial [Deltaproteobacteria bacterium]|nr:PEGA domain-containing protein [Deltaproteobacteria bacterium]
MRWAAIALLACASTVARAQTSDETPAEVFRAGTAAYKAGNLTAAIAAFEEVYRRDPRPETAFTLAQAHRNQFFVDHDAMHLRRAFALYRQYLDEAPAGPRARHARLHAETLQVLLETLPVAIDAPRPDARTQLLVTADAPGATASIDGDAPERLPRLVEVEPGDHRVRIAAPGHDPIDTRALAVAERLVVVPASPVPWPARLAIRTRRDARVEIDGHVVGRDAT